MTKEEQIEKMAKDIAGIEQQDDLTLGEVYGIEATFELAEILCDAGYRKAEEVRKETAREILQKIKAFPRDWIHSYQKGAIILREAEINQIATEFGVEVEE